MFNGFGFALDFILSVPFFVIFVAIGIIALFLLIRKKLNNGIRLGLIITLFFVIIYVILIVYLSIGFGSAGKGYVPQPKTSGIYIFPNVNV